MRGRATGGHDARIGTEAGWATNPETLGKDSYNPALAPHAWGYIYKAGRCFWCFQKWTLGHVCDRDAPREIPSLQVRSTSAAVSQMPDKMPKSQCEKTTVEDETESVLLYSMNNAPKQQTVSKAITVHASLAAISAVCDEVTAKDLQTEPTFLQKSQKQKSDLRIPPIWVPTPKIGVPAHTPTHRNCTGSTDNDDRMLHPKIFKQVQKLSNHTFTLDACANSKGDNVLCSRYCSVEDLFLTRDLKGEFVWLNPPFKRANEFLEAYFAQKRAYPDQVGACILLPCWRQFANIPELRQMTVLKQFTPGTHLFSQPGQDQSHRRNMAGVPWAVNVYYDPPRRSTFHAQAHQGRQALVFTVKVGEQRAQLLLDTGTTNRSFINAATCRRLGILIRTPMPLEQRHEANRKAPSIAVDPTEFADTPLGTPKRREDPGVLPHMLTPVTYGNGVQATPLGVASLTL